MASSLLALRRNAAALPSTSNAVSPSSSSLSTSLRQQRRKPPRRRTGRAAVSAEEDDDLELEEEEPELDKTPKARPSPKGSLSKPNGLAASAAAFAADVKAGVSPEDAAAAALGAREAKALTEAQKKYADKVAAALAAKAEADARAKAEKARKFELGKALYAKGMYPQSVKALVVALDAEGPFSQLGGEIQLWLALAHSATGDEAAAIQVYREVEASHPSPKMRRQAYDLRYIAEAPKLRVGEDEKPLLPEVEPPRIGGEKDKRRAPRPPPAPRGNAAKRTRPMTLEVREEGGGGREREGGGEFFPKKNLKKLKQKKPKILKQEKFMEEYRPPNLIQNKYVAVAAGVVAVAAAVFSATVEKGFLE